MGHMKNRDSNRRRREDRQVQAKIRQEAYDKLTLAEKLATLPVDGAQKQRAKLAKQMNQPPVDNEHVAPGAEQFSAEVIELNKPKKGAKARRQAKKDKKAE